MHLRFRYNFARRWALAAVLLVCEMMLPGVVFLFLAIGAAIAGLMLLVAADVSLELQLFVFRDVGLNVEATPGRGTTRIYLFHSRPQRTSPPS